MNGVLELTRVAFVCACGYGQKGGEGYHTGDPKDTPHSPEEARAWDGVTILEVPKGEKPVCPSCKGAYVPGPGGTGAASVDALVAQLSPEQRTALAAALATQTKKKDKTKKGDK